MIFARQWWGWFGGGLALAGSMITGWAYFVWRSLPSSPARPPILTTAALILGGSLILWLVVAVVRTARNAAGRQSDGARPPADVRVRAWACAVVLGAPAVFGWIKVGDGFAAGVPEVSEAAFAAGLTAAVAGFVVMAIAFTPVKRGIAGAVGGSTVVAAITAAAVVAAVVLPVNASTTEKSGRSAAVPASVSKVGWQWKTPDDRPVEEVVIAGDGPVVKVTDGLVALDGVTGKERWHHRRPGSRAGDFWASPDGNTVMVEFGWRAWVLDAHTGEVVGVRSQEWGSHPEVRLSSRGVVTWHSGRPGLTGWDPATSEISWRYEAPGGCVEGPGSRSTSPREMARDVFALVIFCAPGIEEEANKVAWRRDEGGQEYWQYKRSRFTVTVLGLDPATGAEVWRHERKVSAMPYTIEIHRSSAADALSVIWGEREGVVLAQASGKVIAEQRVTGPFTANGSLVAPERVPSKVDDFVYRWEPFGTGGQKRVSLSLAGLERSHFGDLTAVDLPLDSALITAYPSWNGNMTMTVTALVAPWDTPETVRIPIGLPWHERTSDTRLHLSVLRAPGSVIVSHTESSTITGLV
ncbi:outer membrane protein assembly factor BamB family protein [Nonomuraea turcica]|uniref:outer membrane protein assembly factor BamB family protein n=1 Tax=Nonomuraea sp. G32 TaxID=3067274 RepID=UPI00273AAFB6|nr:PQQ-binding-like beta-propeller repeat protein [Nonomuraea sp. G32]MDP4511562.1 PQQ-binding-like beta-propeller repeat protein [Nonomuraea sp. G32]